MYLDFISPPLLWASLSVINMIKNTHTQNSSVPRSSNYCKIPNLISHLDLSTFIEPQFLPVPYEFANVYNHFPFCLVSVLMLREGIHN